MLAKLDNVIRKYLGLNVVKTTPQLISNKAGKLSVLNTESFKRHVHWEAIDAIDLKKLDSIDREKLGIAVGKVLAAQLIVSFDEVVIKYE